MNEKTKTAELFQCPKHQKNFDSILVYREFLEMPWNCLRISKAYWYIPVDIP